MKLFYQNLNDNFIARHAMGFVKVLSMLAIGIQKKKKTRLWAQVFFNSMPLVLQYYPNSLDNVNYLPHLNLKTFLGGEKKISSLRSRSTLLTSKKIPHSAKLKAAGLPMFHQKDLLNTKKWERVSSSLSYLSNTMFIEPTSNLGGVNQCAGYLYVRT